MQPTSSIQHPTSIHPSSLIPAPCSLPPDPCTLFPAPPHCAHGKSRAWPEDSDWQATQAHYKAWVPGTTLQLESAQLCVGPRGSATANIEGDSDFDFDSYSDSRQSQAPIIHCRWSRRPRAPVGNFICGKLRPSKMAVVVANGLTCKLPFLWHGRQIGLLARNDGLA